LVPTVSFEFEFLEKRSSVSHRHGGYNLLHFVQAIPYANTMLKPLNKLFPHIFLLS
jgi:hypothetical protein